MTRGPAAVMALLVFIDLGGAEAKAQGRLGSFTPSAQEPAPAPSPEPAPTPAKPKPSAAPSPTPSATAGSEAPTVQPTDEPPPPYEPQLLRLGELMGALSYLRDLCRDGDTVKFRDKFAELVQIEAHSAARKDELAGAFNRGFGDYQLTYRTCTASARETIVRYLDETQRIARDVATRYGG